MADSMVERVARAIFVVHSGHGEDWDNPDRIIEMAKPRFHDMARAAIEAMREPTDTMLYEGQADPSLDLCRLGALTVWEAMIGAALADGERT